MSIPAQAIAPPNPAAAHDAAQRQQTLLKPPGALGRLEELAIWFAARQGLAIPVALRPAITVFAADHGVAAQGVSAFPQSVTREMLKSLCQGQAAIAVLARDLGAIYNVIDVGVINAPQLAAVQNQSIAQGTQDLSLRAAMSAEQVQRALAVGALAAQQAIDAGANILLAGEVGIANTTSAACLIAAFTQQPPESIVGSGTGITPSARQHKLQVVSQALARVAGQRDAQALLAELGGLEIAAMSGFYLHAASQGVPVLLDGFISTAAALAACAIAPAAQDWMLASHQSAERGHALALKALQLRPLIEFDMRLGEGSGAALVLPLLQSALSLHRHMATFAQAGVPGAT